MRKTRHANVGTRSYSMSNRHCDSRHSAACSATSEPGRSMDGKTCPSTLHRSRPDGLDKRNKSGGGSLDEDKDTQLRRVMSPGHSSGHGLLRSEPDQSRPLGSARLKECDMSEEGAFLPTHSGSNKKFSRQELSFCHIAGFGRSEPEPRRIGELGKREEHEDMHHHQDRDREFYSQKLSHYNGTLLGRESTAMKFQWDASFVEKPVNTNASRDLGQCVNDKRISTSDRTGTHYSMRAKDHWLSDAQLGRALHEEQEKAFLYNFKCTSAANDYFGGSSKDGIPMYSAGMERSREMLGEPTGHHDMYGQGGVFESPAISELPVKDFARHSLNENLERNYRCPEIHQSDRSDHSASASEFHYNMTNMYATEFHCRNMTSCRPRPRIVDSVVDKIEGADSSLRYGVTECKVLDQHGFLREEQQDEKVLGYRMSSLADKNEPNLDYESRQLGEDYGFKICSTMTHLDDIKDPFLDSGSLQLDRDLGVGRDGGPPWFEDDVQSWSLSEDDKGVYETNHITQHMLTASKLAIEDQSEKMIQRNRIIDLRSSTKLYQEWDPVNEVPDLPNGDQKWSDEDIDQLSLLNSSQYGHFPNGRPIDSDYSLPLTLQECLGKPWKPSSRNIKKRLGPRLKVRTMHPWVKNYAKNHCLRRNLENLQGNLHAEWGESMKLKAKCETSEPPEDSGEFKQQVHNAFLKFTKVLNENSAQQRKYMEQGNGILKCWVCGSNSREFVSTVSLAMHAFNSQMVAVRADHLGFHRALCVLMGWKYAVASGRSWVVQKLPDAEAMALKKDLIIWPPVVVVHNSSIQNHYPFERMIVSVEELEASLKGMGFGPGMRNVCCGRPANQSIMIVSFKGTLSGLQEAERLHQLYLETKHGRADFQQLNFSCSRDGSGSSSSISGRESKELLVDKVKGVLYGYLGLAGDLYKLGFEIMRRTVVKSKNDIKAIADAPLGG